jgi:putative membrane protein
MLYLKAFHILAVLSWMAGIFYLPRIFVHYAEGLRANEDIRRLKVMARKLYHFMSMMAVFALASGLWLWLAYWRDTGHWVHAKLAMVVLLIAYHITCRVLMKRTQRDVPLPGPTALRWFNELPLLVLIPILWLVVVKPF